MRVHCPLSGSFFQLDGRLLGVVLEFRPAGFRRHPEDILPEILVSVFGDFSPLDLIPDEIFAFWVGGLTDEPLAA